MKTFRGFLTEISFQKHPIKATKQVISRLASGKPVTTNSRSNALLSKIDRDKKNNDTQQTATHSKSIDFLHRSTKLYGIASRNRFSDSKAADSYRKEAKQFKIQSDGMEDKMYALANRHQQLRNRQNKIENIRDK